MSNIVLLYLGFKMAGNLSKNIDKCFVFEWNVVKWWGGLPLAWCLVLSGSEGKRLSCRPPWLLSSALSLFKLPFAMITIVVASINNLLHHSDWALSGQFATYLYKELPPSPSMLGTHLTVLGKMEDWVYLELATWTCGDQMQVVSRGLPAVL